MHFDVIFRLCVMVNASNCGRPRQMALSVVSVTAMALHSFSFFNACTRAVRPNTHVIQHHGAIDTTLHAPRCGWRAYLALGHHRQHSWRHALAVLDLQLHNVLVVRHPADREA